MLAIWIIALNTYREIIRDRILYSILVGAVLIIGFSLALGNLSFAEQSRITANFGLTAIQLSSIVLSIFLGSSLVTKEIEKKTIMTLLVRPVTRIQFLLGKAMGLILLQLTTVTLLALVLGLIFLNIGVEISNSFGVALLGVFLESITLLGMTLFFSTFSTPLMVVAFSLGLFLIGHWVDSLNFFFLKDSSGPMSIAFAKIVGLVVPNLDRFDWKKGVIYGNVTSIHDLSLATLYAVSWFLILISISAFIIRRKDFA